MKKIVVLTVGALMVFLGWHVHSRAIQKRRYAAYQDALAVYQRDLRAGMTRADVETYLDSKKVRYSAVFVGRDNAWSYETNIAQEPSDSLFCESWMVYVAFDFS